MKKIVLLVLVCFIPVLIFTSPYLGKEFQLLQPDGSRVSVLVYGDEFYQDVEGLDGYTLIRDPETGWICYAELSGDGMEYISTKKIYLLAEYDLESAKMIQNKSKKMKKHLRVKSKTVKKKRNQRKNELFNNNLPEYDLLNDWVNLEENVKMISENEAAPLTGIITGLTILVDFPDVKSGISQNEIDNFVNQPGYANYNNLGSVKDYFYHVSDGNLTYQNIVTAYVTMPNNKSYYDTPDGYGNTRELVITAFEILKSQGFDFSLLSVKNNRFTAVNILYAGNPDYGWANGLWPHSGGIYNYYVNGIEVGPYQMSNIGSDLSIGTFVHENGHMICGWPDLYAYDGHDYGVGYYCVMGWVNGKKPQTANPYFRDLLGWINVTGINEMPQGTVFSSIANSNYVHRFTNNINEHFYIEARRKKDWSDALPDEGLLIWHVYELGKNQYIDYPNLVSVEQADGQYHIENKVNGGDQYDLFDSSFKSVFNNFTNPDSKWINGSSSGLNINNVSEIADVMYFTYGEGNTLPYIIITDPESGSIFNEGDNIVVSADAYDNDGSITQVEFFSGSASLGIDNTAPYSITLNNVQTGQYNIYAAATDNNGGKTESAGINITVQSVLEDLPAPWQDQDIGNPLNGNAGYKDNNFVLNGSGEDIWGTSDHFHFVYQPLSGDGTITARVIAITDTNMWAKAGVMIRDSLTSDSMHAMMVVTPGNGLAFQRRNTYGDISYHTYGGDFYAPYYVKITRSGNIITGSVSNDGTNWIDIDSETVTFSDTVYVGLIVTSHDNTKMCEAKFDNVNVSADNNVNLPPSVNLTAPSNGETFETGTNITISADASDSDGSITLVEFYEGNIKIGEDSSYPYSIIWNNTAAGNYNITAAATDNEGARSVSGIYSIIVEDGNTQDYIILSTADKNKIWSIESEMTFQVQMESNGVIQINKPWLADVKVSIDNGPLQDTPEGWGGQFYLTPNSAIIIKIIVPYKMDIQLNWW